MPRDLNSNVWWLWIGTNDLARGGCSEEATVLGILRTAEEIAYHNPGSVVVIMAILPRSTRADGSLESKRPHRVENFFSKNTEEQEVERARREFLLWPSIQAVNAQLREFCQKNDHMVYFDASAYFLGSVGNEYFKGRQQVIMADLMPDHVHPSFHGYKVLGDAIHDEVLRILFDDDEENDIEEKTTGGGGRKK
jgi:lysophospholipase L1-like esterase